MSDTCPKNNLLREIETSNYLSLDCQPDHLINIQCNFYGVAKEFLNLNEYMYICIEYNSYFTLRKHCHHKSNCSINDLNILGTNCKYHRKKLLVQYTCEKLSSKI